MNSFANVRNGREVLSPGVIDLGERECTLQRQHQKVVEQARRVGMKSLEEIAAHAATRANASRRLRKALAWPFVFLKGKNVFLETGTLFDAVVRASTQVEVPDVAPAAPVETWRDFQVEVDYEELDLDKKIKMKPANVSKGKAGFDIIKPLEDKYYSQFMSCANIKTSDYCRHFNYPEQD